MISSKKMVGISFLCSGLALLYMSEIKTSSSNVPLISSSNSTPMQLIVPPVRTMVRQADGAPHSTSNENDFESNCLLLGGACCVATGATTMIGGPVLAFLCMGKVAIGGVVTGVSVIGGIGQTITGLKAINDSLKK